MTLQQLINVLDADTYFTVVHDYEDIFKGVPDEFDKAEYNVYVVKVVWFSKIYNTLMIEI